MKAIVILGDGMADEPLEELGGKTPIEYANTPYMDWAASNGACGMLKTVPDGMVPGSDVANLSVLGYDPHESYTGRGPLEAVSMGIDFSEDAIAYRCNLVTIEDGIMADFSAGHITGDDGPRLIESLNEALPEGIRVYPGVSYRNLLILQGGKGSESAPPHDIVGQEIDPHVPKGPDKDILLEAMNIAAEVFKDHPVNRERIARGEKPATGIWPWSGGRKPSMKSFKEKYGVSGGMISAVDLLNGIAMLAKMEIITVPGATGFLDTDYMAKAKYALEGLERLDFIYMHVEAPDEAGHMGSIEEKVKAIERLDEAIGTILENTDAVIGILPDHPTPIRLKTHTSNPVPFIIVGRGRDRTNCYSEKEAAENGGFGLIKGDMFMKLLLGQAEEKE
jgi:2,3-bisphosphoglycerate-independent phosphoglycerate mutase